MKISVIIPAYNSAKYLHRCISSVSKQDLSSELYEAIVINDGSTDETVDVLNSLCQEFPFLRFVTTENRGLSLARNRGILESAGECVVFLDSDDTVLPYTLGSIYQEMLINNLDMMLTNYLFVSSEGYSLEIPFKVEGNSRLVVSGKEFLLNDHYLPMVWSYVYKRSFLLDNKLEMIPIWHEDEEFTPRAIYLAERIKYYPMLFYRYHQNSGSFMVDYQESNMLYIIDAMSSLSQFSLTQINDSQVKRYFDNRIAAKLMQLFKNSIRWRYNNQDELIVKMKEAHLLPLQSKRWHFYFWLFNTSPSFFELYYRAIRRKPKK